MLHGIVYVFMFSQSSSLFVSCTCVAHISLIGSGQNYVRRLLIMRPIPLYKPFFAIFGVAIVGTTSEELLLVLMCLLFILFYVRSEC